MALFAQREVIGRSASLLLLCALVLYPSDSSGDAARPVDGLPSGKNSDSVYTRLAAAIVKGGSAIAVDEKTELVVYSTICRVEGAGQAALVWFSKIGQAKPLEHLEVYQPGDEVDLNDLKNKIQKAVDNIASRLKKGGYRGVYGTKVDMEGGKMSIPGGTFQWQKDRAMVSLGDRAGVVRVRLKKPYVAHPQWVYSAHDLPFAAVSVQRDPGGSYGEGYDLYTTVEFIRLKTLPVGSTK
jgi:hypothetical protein